MSKKILVVVGALVLIAAAAVVLLILKGDENSWLCQSGQWVKHGHPSAPMPTSGCGTTKPTPTLSQVGEIIINSPQSDQIVSSPITISGSARGSWYFEAVFPIKLLDSSGNILAQIQARAQGEWTTENFVPFVARLSYNLTATSTGTLLFNNDNPSGLPQNNKEFRVPVIIGPSR